MIKKNNKSPLTNMVVGQWNFVYNFLFLGYNRLTNKVVETPGKGVDDICGWAILDNHSVNLLSSLFCGLLTPKVAFYLWWMFV